MAGESRTLLRNFGNGDDGYAVWMRPERGAWRWSYCRNVRFPQASRELREYPFNEIDNAEMELLGAEALYRQRDRARRRHPHRRDTGGRWPQCHGPVVSQQQPGPPAPNGQCGDLLEMLTWEKRAGVNLEGLYGAPWFFDAWGW